MIRAVRLKEQDKRTGNLMRGYTSSHSGTKYLAGAGGIPSPLKIVEDPKEIAELREIDQFEILEFADEEEMAEHVQLEMEARARLGGPAARAQILPAHKRPSRKAVPTAKKGKGMPRADKVLPPLSKTEVEEPEEVEVAEDVEVAEEKPAPTKKKKATKKKATKKKASRKKASKK